MCEGGECQEIFLTMRKINAQDLYFLQPDIKKITKHKSIRGENCIFSLTHSALLSFHSVSLSPCFYSVSEYVSMRPYIKSMLDIKKL